LGQHAKDVRLALEAPHGVGVDGVGAEDLGDDDEAAWLVPVGGEHPTLATFADALAKVILDATAPPQDLPGQTVPQRD
jgi:hypothetical protein